MPDTPIKQRLLSRNFWNFAIAATIATTAFVWLLKRCHDLDGSFNHEAADGYFNTWGNTIALFTVLFLGKEMGNKVLEAIPAMRGKKKEPEPAYNPQTTEVVQ